MKKIKENKQNLKKDFFWNTLGSSLNAFMSLFFMIIVTRINGIDDSGIFTFAFSTATLFYIIGVYAGRVYQVTDTDKISNNDYLINKFIACLIMLIISIVFIIVRNYNFVKSMVILVLCILKMLEAFSEFNYAYFQKNYYLYRVGISLTIKTIISIIVFLIIDLLTKNILISSISLIVFYLIIMIIYDFKFINIKAILKEKSNFKNVITIFTKGFFTFCLSFLTMYIVNIPRYIIDANMKDKFSSIFGILIMPASVMVLFAQFVLQPFIMKIKKCLENNDYKGLSKLVLSIIGSLLIIGIFVLIGAYLLGIPILELLYSIDLSNYKTSLMFIIIGSIMYSVIVIISNILISMRVTFYQVLIYGIGSIISLFLSNKLVLSSGVAGACLSYLIIMGFTFICFILLMILSINSKKRGVLKNDKS